MGIKLFLFIFIPIVFFSVFMIMAHLKQRLEDDRKLTRRVYYINFLVWIVLFSTVFYEEISKFTIIEVDWSPQNSFNFIFFILIMFVLSIVWDFLFISCGTFKNIKLKDIEFTIEDIKNVKYVELLQEKEINALYSVLNSKIKTLKHIDRCFDTSLDFDIGNLYTSVIKEYGKIRRQIKIYTYYNSEEGRNKLKREIKLSDELLSSIMCATDMFGFCKPQEFRKNKYIFAKLNTKYLADDILFVLKGNLLIDKEHIIIIEIISYLEQKLEMEILRMDLCTNQQEE